MASRARKYLRMGFTLLELLIVLVILAVLAGLAVPGYSSSVEKMRTTEAMSYLINARHAMQRYYMENGSYSGATLSVALGTNLDYNPNDFMTGNTRLFDYTFSAGPAANTYIIRAARDPIAGCGGASPYSIFIDQDGVVTRS